MIQIGAVNQVYCSNFITILLHFLFPLYFIFKTEYTKIIRIQNDFSGRFCKTFRQQAQQE